MKKIYSCVNHKSRLIALLLFTVGQLSLAGTDPANKTSDRKASLSKRSFAHQTLQKTATPAVSTDPIRFTLKADKQAVAPGEEVTLTITAIDLNINSALLFTFAEAKAFRLKVLMPKSFVQTGGDYTDYVGATLSPERPYISYTLKGYFADFTRQSQFRLLRGSQNADANSLFVEKAHLQITVNNAKGGRLSTDNVTLSANCDASTLSISGYLSVNNRVGIVIYKDDAYVGSISDISGPSFNQSFPLSGSGSYYARVVEINRLVAKLINS